MLHCLRQTGENLLSRVAFTTCRYLCRNSHIVLIRINSNPALFQPQTLSKEPQKGLDTANSQNLLEVGAGAPSSVSAPGASSWRRSRGRPWITGSCCRPCHRKPGLIELRLCTQTCIHLYMGACMFMSTYTYMYTYIHTYAYICLSMCLCSSYEIDNVL